jgi:hypothetical protein
MRIAPILESIQQNRRSTASLLRLPEDSQRRVSAYPSSKVASQDRETQTPSGEHRLDQFPGSRGSVSRSSNALRSVAQPEREAADPDRRAYADGLAVIRGPVPQQQMDGLRCFGLPVVCEARRCLPGNDRSKSRCLRGSPYGTRLRGMSSRSGIVPPRDASLRALSRSISDLRASRTSAVFSVIPVNSWAVRIRSSSIARVVRIPASMHQL